jgi:hypothetical protein
MKFTPCEERKHQCAFFLRVHICQGVTRGYKDGLQPETLADGKSTFVSNPCLCDDVICLFFSLQQKVKDLHAATFLPFSGGRSKPTAPCWSWERVAGLRELWCFCAGAEN